MRCSLRRGVGYTYTYDLIGNVLTYTDRLSRTYSYTYDALGNQLTQSMGTTVVSESTYAKTGLLVNQKLLDEATMGYKETVYTYDALGRAVYEAESLANGKYAQKAYAYDINGKRTSFELDVVSSEELAASQTAAINAVEEITMSQMALEGDASLMSGESITITSAVTSSTSVVSGTYVGSGNYSIVAYRSSGSGTYSGSASGGTWSVNFGSNLVTGETVTISLCNAMGGGVLASATATVTAGTGGAITVTSPTGTVIDNTSITVSGTCDPNQQIVVSFMFGETATATALSDANGDFSCVLTPSSGTFANGSYTLLVRYANQNGYTYANFIVDIPTPTATPIPTIEDRLGQDNAYNHLEQLTEVEDTVSYTYDANGNRATMVSKVNEHIYATTAYSYNLANTPSYP